MKKTLLILIASLAICGSTFAQHESHWADVSFNQFDMNAGIVAFIQVDNNYITTNDNWTDLEVAAFVDNECRGHAFMQDGTSFGDPYPLVEMSIYHMLTTTGEAVSFKLYDHSIGLEYDYGTCNYNIVTGEYHIEIYQMDYENAVVLSFTTPFTKEIAAYTSSGGWYLIASPLDGEIDPQNVGNMLNADFDLYRFNQSAQTNDQGLTLEWENWKKQGDHYHFNLEAGKGYLYANSEDVTLTFTGTAYNGNGEVPLAYDEQADFPGWNLIGNPYGTNATLSQPYYRMNETGSALNAYTETTAIAAMEGVFVQAATHGQTVTFTAQTRGNAVAPVALTNIIVSDKNGSVIDNAIIRYDQGSTLGKFQLDPSHSMLYIPQDGKDYAIIDAEAQGELPLNFKASENGTYTLSVNPENVKMNYLHLIDNMTGAKVDLLATPSYTFEAKTNDYASRFKLVFVCEDGFSTGSETFAFISNGKFVVMNEGQATLQVIDMMGRVLSSENLSGNDKISHSQTPGVYMLRLINGNNVKTQKIIIK